jgi:hypothetical protein
MANLVMIGSKSKIHTTMSYARYLMSVHLGRVLDKSEHVDHINGDKLDDRVENFQLLSLTENAIKYRSTDSTAPSVVLTCPICKKIFSRSRHHAYQVVRLGKEKCCSRECGHIKMMATTKANKQKRKETQK